MLVIVFILLRTTLAYLSYHNIGFKCLQACLSQFPAQGWDFIDICDLSQGSWLFESHWVPVWILLVWKMHSLLSIQTQYWRPSLNAKASVNFSCSSRSKSWSPLYSYHSTMIELILTSSVTSRCLGIRFPDNRELPKAEFLFIKNLLCETSLVVSVKESLQCGGHRFNLWLGN